MQAGRSSKVVALSGEDYLPFAIPLSRSRSIFKARLKKVVGVEVKYRIEFHEGDGQVMSNSKTKIILLYFITNETAYMPPLLTDRDRGR